MKIDKKCIITVLCTLFFSVLFFTEAAHASEYEVLEKIPGISEKNPSFSVYFQGVYNFATGFVIIAALLMVSIGGFYYITSAGNQAQAGTAKKIITDALLGLVVVFAAWLLLYTINPDLIGSEPDMTKLREQAKNSVDSKSSNHSDPNVSHDPSSAQTYCDSTTTTIACYGSKEDCVADAGESRCQPSSNSFDGGKYYNCSGSTCEEFDDKESCEKSGATNCMSGNQAKADKLYNPQSNDDIAKSIEDGGGKISADAKKNANKMTQKTMDNAVTLSGQLGGEITDISSKGNSYTIQGGVGGGVGGIGAKESKGPALKKLESQAKSDSGITEMSGEKVSGTGNNKVVTRTYRYEYAADYPDSKLAGTVILRSEKTYHGGRDIGYREITEYGDLNVYAAQSIKK